MPIPVPIDPEDLRKFACYDPQRIVIAGDEGGGILAVEAVVCPRDEPPGPFQFSMKCRFSDEDIRLINENPHVWLHQYAAQIRPFAITMDHKLN